MIPTLDKKYWNNLYLNNESGWDVGEISNPLKNYFLQLKNKTGKILIPGAGNSYEAEFLLQNGFTNVFICDFAEEPLKNIANRCKNLKSENLLKCNFFDLKSNSYDLIIEQTFFCALNPELRKKYFEKMHALLKPGGKLVGLLFNHHFENDSPPYGGTESEYKSYFVDLFKIKVFENCYNSIQPRLGRELFINLEKNS